MPGPVSDSYDPTWGTASNADLVRDAIGEVRDKIGAVLGGLRYILAVAREENGLQFPISFSERELRLLRFACRVALGEDTI